MITLSSEAQFILLATRDARAVAPRALARSAAGVRDWQRLVDRAVAHGVASFVLDAAARATIALPDMPASRLRDARFVAVAQAMQLDHALRRICDACRDARVPLIVLKGPVLARTVYPDPRLRPYSDLDLTVREIDETTAVAILNACALVEVPYDAEAARRTHAGHVDEAAFHRVFRSTDHQVMVELHLDPLQLGLRPTTEAARWRRAVNMPGMPGALMLCAEDQLVQLTVHAQKHGFSRLIWLKDLDLLMRTYGDTLDWTLVRTIAAKEGVLASVWYGLGLTSLLLCGPVSGDLLAALRPSWPVRTAYRVVWPPTTIANLGGFMRRRAVQFHAAESWRGMVPSLVLMGRRRARARMLLHTLRPSRWR